MEVNLTKYSAKPLLKCEKLANLSKQKTELVWVQTLFDTNLLRRQHTINLTFHTMCKRYVKSNKQKTKS
jgi:hypothetical protein